MTAPQVTAIPDYGTAIRGVRSEGHDSLPATRSLVGDAAVAIAREPNRMGAWRMLGAALEARKAFQSHMALCKSHYGPLLHMGEERPWLQPAIRRLQTDQERILAGLDRLISLAARNKTAADSAAHELRAAAAQCSATIGAYEAHYHALVFEWVNRDIGGPG